MSTHFRSRFTFAAVLSFMALSGLFLAGCESYYWPKDQTGGFAEELLPNGQWKVTMSAPLAKSESYVKDLCLYRCADLALEKGAVEFVIKDEKMVTVLESQERTDWNVEDRPDKSRGGFSIHGPHMRSMTLYIEFILMGEKSPNSPDAYEVEQVLREIGAKRNLEDVADLKSRPFLHG
ncbi:CC0125/CC1285 family lipoprotein [Pelagicoccus albus]|uniref:Uncharacterized protein n=1 Tax=Pelagicoccus albus TaxID=415222 RepID=A0A7X1B9B7_9BACT|nr:hypothetical protein [Pelagicoccus albus]MBC2608066.1 hypothetical protein [Pelagicoccus albus]